MKFARSEALRDRRLAFQLASEVADTKGVTAERAAWKVKALKYWGKALYSKVNESTNMY